MSRKKNYLGEHDRQLLQDSHRQDKHTQEDNEAAAQIESLHGKAADVEKIAGGVLDAFFRFATKYKGVIKNDLGWLSLLLSIIFIPISMFKIVHSAVINKRSDHVGIVDRTIDIVGSIGGITLSIVGIISMVGVITIATPILIITSAAKGVAESIWGVAVALYDRFSGKNNAAMKKAKDKIIQENLNTSDADLANNDLKDNGQNIKKLTADINTKRRQNGAVASRLHGFAQASIALIGAGLLFTPALPIGMIILGTVALYGVLDVLNVNPFKLLIGAINFISSKIPFIGKPLLPNPFEPKTEATVKKELVAEIKREKENAIKAEKPNQVTEAEKDKTIAADQNKKPIHNSAVDISKGLHTSPAAFNSKNSGEKPAAYPASAVVEVGRTALKKNETVNLPDMESIQDIKPLIADVAAKIETQMEKLTNKDVALPELENTETDNGDSESEHPHPKRK